MRVIGRDFLARVHVADPPVGAHRPQQVGEARIVGHHHPAFDGGDVVREVEAEAGEMAEAADPFAVPREAPRASQVSSNSQRFLRRAIASTSVTLTAPPST